MRALPSWFRLSALIIACGLAPAALAQAVHWDPPGGTLPAGQTTALQLVFDDCEPKSPPVPPKVDGLTLEYTGQSSNMSWINGSYSHSVICNYSALLAKKQAVEIPSFEIETTKGNQTVAATRFDPTAATVGDTGQAVESAANSTLEISSPAVWAGEVFNLRYRIEAAPSYYPDFGHGALDWSPDPLMAEDWSQPEPFDASSSATPQTGLIYRTRAIIRNPGTYRVNPIGQLVNLSVGVSGLGFFQQRQYQQFLVTSSRPTIAVRPLPPAPAGFSGAVGDFKLTSKVVPTHAAVGDPITWTLELKGTGNWPVLSGLPSREVSKDFQVVQPKAKRTAAANKLFDSTLSEDVVLVPTKAGVYALDPVKFIYFDPKEGDYKTLATPETNVAISAPAGGETAPPAAKAGTEQDSPSPEIRTPVSPPAPAGLPRDTLPDAGPAPTPLSTGVLLFLLLAPLPLLLIFWSGLALRRARRTDPRRPLREAHGRLAALLASRPGDQNAMSGEDLLAWQRDTAILWEIDHAAPSAGAFVQEPRWASLWADTERALYGPDTVLPSDWVSRAAAALAAKPARAFAPGQLFLPRNLLPFLFALSLPIAALPPAKADSASAAAAYHQGDFAAAEKAWRDTVLAEPANWAARHDLSLAMAQQNRWGEAAAEAAAAFVQQPGNAAVRWQFALACDKAGFAPAALEEFLTPGPVKSFARLASPAVWERVLIAAAWLAAAALGGLVAFGYKRGEGGGGRVEDRQPASLPPPTSRLLPYASISALVFAAAVAVMACVGWFSYGEAADEQAAVSWSDATLYSIPTEADIAQKTEPLAAGSMALADKSFLGWVRLSFENGQTGWGRKDAVVGLWKEAGTR